MKQFWRSWVVLILFGVGLGWAQVDSAYIRMKEVGISPAPAPWPQVCHGPSPIPPPTAPTPSASAKPPTPSPKPSLTLETSKSCPAERVPVYCSESIIPFWDQGFLNVKRGWARPPCGRARPHSGGQRPLGAGRHPKRKFM